MSGSQPERIGKYEILSVLGEGGMGVVYKARDTIIDRLVAIKTILTTKEFDDQNLIKRLRMEAQSAGRLHHPNIVTIFDFGEEKELAYLVMEYVEGSNLARMINNNHLIPLDKKLDILVQLSNGLAYAHERGVVHRDMKPSNVCVTSDGIAKILDFGLARFDDTRLTKTGFASGTVSYMSPERMRGESGPSDDIFALGTVAYELLTYTSAFPGKNYPEVVQKILSNQYPIKPSAVAELPPEIDALILKAVARDKVSRYQTAGDFGKAIDQFRHSKIFNQFAEQKTFIRDTPFEWGVDQKSGKTPYTAPEIEQQHEPTAEVRPAGELETVAISPPESVRSAVAPTLSPDGDQALYAPTVIDSAPRTLVEPRPAAGDQALYAPTVIDSVARTLVEPRPAAGDQALYAPTVIDSVARTLVEPRPKAGPTGTVVTPKAEVTPEPSTISETISGITKTVVDRLRWPRKRSPSGEAAALAGPTQAAEAVPVTAAVAGVARDNRMTMIFAAALGVLTLTAPVVYSLVGMSAFLIAYGGAAYLWTWMIRRPVKPTLLVVLGFAVALRLPMFFFAPPSDSGMELYLADAAGRLTETVSVPVAKPAIDDAAGDHAAQKKAPKKGVAGKTTDTTTPETAASVKTTPHPPFARLLFLLWSSIGDRLFVWRLLLLLGDLALIFMIYGPGYERRALAYAAFPIVVLEGVWDGRVEILAALFLFAALAAFRKEHDGRGGILLGFAVGSTFYSLFAIPAALRASIASIGMIIGALLGFFIPAYYFGLSNAWLGRIAYSEFNSAPIQLVYQTTLQVIGDNGVAGALRDRWLSLTSSVPGKSITEAVARSITTNSLTIALLIVLLGAVTIYIASHSRDFDSGVANGVGAALLLTAAAPWYWLLVVPFAIAANRPAWILYALFCPVVYLALDSGGAPAWFAWGAFYLIPAMIALGLKLQKASGENVTPALDLSTK